MADRKERTRTARLRRFRVWVQGAFALVWLGPFIGRFQWMCSPVYHCYACPLALFACPIGVIANFSALHVFPFIAVGTLVLVGGLIGAFVCGWACPFGFLQDLAAKISKPKLALPRWSAHGRYAVLLLLVLVIPYGWGEEHLLFICLVCPAGALEGAVPYVVGQALAPDTNAPNAADAPAAVDNDVYVQVAPAVPPDNQTTAAPAPAAGQGVGAPEGATHILWPGPLKIVILVLFFVAIFVRYRPWCTLFCPLGAIFSLFNRVSLFFLKFHPDRCTHCGICASVCKCEVNPEHHANDPRCIRCLECTRCGALTVSGGAGRKD